MFYQNISYEGHQWRFHCQMIGYFLSSSSANLTFVQAFPWLCLGAWICVLHLFCLPYLLSFPQPMKTAALSWVLFSDRVHSPGTVNQAIAFHPLPRTPKFAPSPVTSRFMDQITTPRLHLPIYRTFLNCHIQNNSVGVPPKFCFSRPSHLCKCHLCPSGCSGERPWSHSWLLPHLISKPQQTLLSLFPKRFFNSTNSQPSITAWLTVPLIQWPTKQISLFSSWTLHGSLLQEAHGGHSISSHCP